MLTAVSTLAPAKLNLALSVGPRDASGLHPLCSWMVTADLHDELELTRLEEDRFSRYAILWHDEAPRRNEIDWPITRDLAVRAHLALEREVGRRLPVQLKLRKRIPVGGGLGGGSSNAAAMLRGVNDLFELGLSDDDLARVGAALGSDVAFLVRGGSALVEGFGERVCPHEIRHELHLALAFPDATCSTSEAYRLFDELSERHGAALRPDAVRVAAAAHLHPAARSEALFNDLTRAAVRIAPRLEDDLAALAALAGRPAHLSGSGSTIFVLADDAMHAGALAAAATQQLGLPALAVRSQAPG